MPRIPEDTNLLYNAHMAFTQLRIEHWLQNNLYSWQWYFLLAMLVIPWIVWWKLVDKKRLVPIIAIGLMVLSTANWMDQVGVEFGWWTYPYKTIPIFPQMIPVNYSMLPVGYMLLYQWYTPWRSYMVAATVLSAIMSWVAEPVIVWMGIYHLQSWHYSFSFPIYIVIAYTHKRIVDAAIEISNNQRKKK